MKWNRHLVIGALLVAVPFGVLAALFAGGLR